MNKHRGEILKRAVADSGMSATRVAKALGVTRQTLYNRYDDPNVTRDFLIEVGKIIKYDFFQEIDSVKGLGPDGQQDAGQEKYNTGETETMLRLVRTQQELIDLQRRHLNLLESVYGTSQARRMMPASK
jgi:predicted transcriptional regulator